MLHFWPFSNFDKCRPEVAGDVVSSVALVYVDADVHAKYGDLIASCNRLETASDIIFGKFVGPNVPDKPIKFCGPCLNRSREIPPKAVRDGIFDVFAITSDRN